MARPRHTQVLLVGDEYGTILKALDLMSLAHGIVPADDRRKAYAALERLLVEGGELSPARLQEMRERYGFATDRRERKPA